MSDLFLHSVYEVCILDIVHCIYDIFHICDIYTTYLHVLTGSNRSLGCEVPMDWKAQDVGGPPSLLCVDTNTTTTTDCANTFVRVNQYPWKSNLPEISRPDGAAGFFQPDGATDTPEVTIALTRLVGASKVPQRFFPILFSSFLPFSNIVVTASCFSSFSI